MWLETRWSGSIEDPTRADLEAALAELQRSDPEHPDTWVGDDEDWTLSIDEGGVMRLTDPEGATVAERTGVTAGQALQFWLLFGSDGPEAVAAAFATGAA